MYRVCGRSGSEDVAQDRDDAHRGAVEGEPDEFAALDDLEHELAGEASGDERGDEPGGEHAAVDSGRPFAAAAGFAVREGATLLVLDEVCAAVSCGFLPEDELLAFLDGKPDDLEVVLTGRNPSEALQARADYITEMVKRRHPFDKGIGARKGIEL